jgi:carboxylesterase type B
MGSFIFAPSIDGDLIPESPHTLITEGKFRPVPLLIGNVKDE